MKQKLDNIWLGFLVGFVGEIIGLLIVFLWYSAETAGSAFDNFMHVLLQGSVTSAKLLIFALIFNAFLFFFIYRMKMDKLANGMVGATLLITIFVVILYTL